MTVIDTARAEFDHIMTILEERETTHGDAARSLQAIATLWSAYLRARTAMQGHKDPPGAPDLDCQDIGHMMVLLKMVRALESPDHLDNERDMIGYLMMVLATKAEKP